MGCTGWASEWDEEKGRHVSMGGADSVMRRKIHFILISITSHHTLHTILSAGIAMSMMHGRLYRVHGLYWEDESGTKERATCRLEKDK